ncbi:hypothetical protein JDV02_005341 [Purpureocillium takamizusanense]|uniref:HTH OST-type domain-containing protein n=1 Tax=Purpureocillium takamizusanense TaxID=2060973 RepID=A0A9Q8VBT2_9HYPO|nr:uncharacterized protein JDV02_005341 [Purpureocillium takamizusanense]UNI19127.1 hypothetical protein JDV02_005341 [Purpureocillium takamizusanense]
MTEDAASGTTTVKLAVLIDADNAQPSRVNYLLAEIAKYGTAFVKRAYGDWTDTNLTGWKERLLKCSIQPVQQFAYTTGKNATDSAMIIDAMDLLYSRSFDGFCLVSSDSDFTRLASRIRESGLVVYGCGERKTPKPFVAACDKFIYVENLVPGGGDAAAAAAAAAAGALVVPAGGTNAAAAAAAVPNQVRWLLRDAVVDMSDADGFANLAKVGGLVAKRHSDFDPRTYGFEKLAKLVEALPHMFEVERREPAVGKPPVVYARVRTRLSH